ncbi:ketosynthase chain-length factor [Amycolatopsis sp. lyj-90]|uniref:ketosynthase chain-length factor n=1 Tax=Amycolatopsis sp. lyj-90 TaxID=2789285 RepID=UPI00397AA9DE
MSGPAANTDPVVTGIGVAAPTGIGAEAHWQAVLAGKSGIGRITRFDSTSYPVRLAGQVPGFVAAERIPNRLVPQTDHWTHLGLAATEEALADAVIDPALLPEYEMAVLTASSSGGAEFGQREMEKLYTSGPSWVGAYQAIAWFYAASAGQVSIRYGIKGPCGVLCCEQAGGLDVLGQGRRLIRSGTRVVVAGGTDASMSPYGFTTQLSNGLMSKVDNPVRAYLPFDVDASGYLPGEGGAMLIVEDAGSAAGRDIGPGYGTIAGYAAGFDPPPASPRPSSLGATLRRALDDAKVDASEVDVVFADGAGVAEGDAAEAAAITETFGPRGVPVSVPKMLTGRLYGGGASLDVATALLALRDNVIPHTGSPIRQAPEFEIALVQHQPREVPLRTAVVLARGFGGFNAAIVLRAAS